MLHIQAAIQYLVQATRFISITREFVEQDAGEEAHNEAIVAYLVLQPSDDAFLPSTVEALLDICTPPVADQGEPACVEKGCLKKGAC